MENLNHPCFKLNFFNLIKSDLESSSSLVTDLAFLLAWCEKSGGPISMKAMVVNHVISSLKPIKHCWLSKVLLIKDINFNQSTFISCNDSKHLSREQCLFKSLARKNKPMPATHWLLSVYFKHVLNWRLAKGYHQQVDSLAEALPSLAPPLTNPRLNAFKRHTFPESPWKWILHWPKCSRVNLEIWSYYPLKKISPTLDRMLW